MNKLYFTRVVEKTRGLFTSSLERLCRINKQELMTKWELDKRQTNTAKTRVAYLCNVSSVWRDQMSSSNYVATATEDTSRLGYKHVCVNDLNMVSHDYQKVIQHTDSDTHTHTHPHTHSLTVTESFYFFSLNSHLSFNTKSSGEWKFQILFNKKHKPQASHKQTKEV